MQSSPPAPAWYDDPGGAPLLRWWDGAQWTSATHPKGAPMPAAQPQGAAAYAQQQYGHPQAGAAYVNVAYGHPHPTQMGPLQVEQPNEKPRAQRDEEPQSPLKHDSKAPPSAVKKFIKLGIAITNTTWFVILSQIIAFILALVSMILVISAFRKLDEATDDVSNIVNNWTLQPIVGVTVVGATASCPAGFGEYPVPVWPGAAAGPCFCRASASTSNGPLESHTGSCNSTERANGCGTDSGIGSITLSDWRGDSKLCVQRGGEPAFNTATEKRRPGRVTATATCPTGYRACGSGNYSTGASCQPTGDPCPIQDTRVVLNGEATPAGYSEIPFGASHKVIYIAPGDSVTPAVDRGMVEVTNGFSTTGEANNYICFSNREGRQLERSGEHEGLPHDNSCSRPDPRFYSIDVLDEAPFILDNFQRNTMCSGPSANQQAFTEFSQSSCSSSDSICSNLWPGTNCEKLTRYANSASGSGLWNLLSRREIQWDVTCPTAMKDVISHASPLREARDLQKIVMIINILSFCFIGVIIPIFVIWNRVTGDVPCCPGKGVNEQYCIKILNKGVGICAKIAKLITVGVSIALLNRLRGFFADAALTDCSDPTTNGNVDFLGDELQEVYDTNIQALVIDTLQVFFALAIIFFTLRKCKKMSH